MGGLDIQNGSMSTLWELDFGTSLDLDNDERLRPGNWKMIQTQGSKLTSPGPVAYHTTCVCKDQVFLFGGNNYSKTIQVQDPTNLEEEKTYTPLYNLNLRTF